jgi:hypothetical protein
MVMGLLLSAARMLSAAAFAATLLPMMIWFAMRASLSKCAVCFRRAEPTLYFYNIAPKISCLLACRGVLKDRAFLVNAAIGEMVRERQVKGIEKIFCRE